MPVLRKLRNRARGQAGFLAWRSHVKDHEREERALHEHHLKNLRKAGYSATDAAKLLELGLEPSGERVRSLGGSGSVPF